MIHQYKMKTTVPQILTFTMNSELKNVKKIVYNRITIHKTNVSNINIRQRKK